MCDTHKFYLWVAPKSWKRIANAAALRSHLPIINVCEKRCLSLQRHNLWWALLRALRLSPAACLLQILRYWMVFTRSAMPKCPPAMAFPSNKRHASNGIRALWFLHFFVCPSRSTRAVAFLPFARDSLSCVCVRALFHCFYLFFLFCFRSFTICAPVQFDLTHKRRVQWTNQEEIWVRMRIIIGVRALAHTSHTATHKSGHQLQSYPIRMEMCAAKCRHTAGRAYVGEATIIWFVLILRANARCIRFRFIASDVMQSLKYRRKIVNHHFRVRTWFGCRDVWLLI